MREATANEMADVLCYLLNLSNVLGIDLSDVLRAKMVKKRRIRRSNIGASTKFDRVCVCVGLHIPSVPPQRRTGGPSLLPTTDRKVRPSATTDRKVRPTKD